MKVGLHWLLCVVSVVLVLIDPSVLVQGQGNNETDVCDDPQWFLLEWLGMEVIMTPSPFALTEFEYSDGSTVLEPDSLVDCVSYTCQSQQSNANAYDILETTYGVSDDYYKTCETDDITLTDTITYDSQDQWKIGCTGQEVGCDGCDCQTQVFAIVEYFTSGSSENTADKRMVSVNTLLDFSLTDGGYRVINDQNCVAMIQSCSYSYTDASSKVWQTCVVYSEEFDQTSWRIFCNVDDSNQINNDNCITTDTEIVTSDDARIGCYYPTDIPDDLVNRTIVIPTPSPTLAPTEDEGKGGGGGGNNNNSNDIVYILLGVAGGLLICGALSYLLARKMEWVGPNSGQDYRFTQLAEAPRE